MKTILYFQSSLAASNMRELEGVRKYAADEGWKVQVSPSSACTPGGPSLGDGPNPEILSVCTGDFLV